ncbi:MAG: SDR family oxidoreductase [Chloroflexi bacterium]|nr:SDR family oxidoreductase [Chloroflexota bacterium]
MSDIGTILVTGATGYIGGRLVSRLLEEGCRVRVLVRSEARVLSRPWIGQVEVVVGDALDSESLAEALDGVDTAYYLIHSMSSGAAFHELDMQVARAFGQAASEASVRHIVYLGGLGDPKANLSTHLRSRQKTGQALRECGVPVTEFRAAVIVGAGSVSFEMIRYLVERLPVMVCPRWIYSSIQPIAIDDLLDYLVAAPKVPRCKGHTIEIGGSDMTTYRGLMLGYARARRLRRLMIPVPVLTPRLSSYWVHWMTPIPSSIAVPLVEGLRNDVVVTDNLAHTLFPSVVPQDYASAIDNVVKDMDAGPIDTSWSDAAGSATAPQELVYLESREGLIIEHRRRSVAAPMQNVFRVCTGIGADRGWYFANWAWRLRGMLDRLLGGAGLRRGRRHPDDLRVGDALDFWRVEALETNCVVRLRAEMKLPGKAWLQFDVLEGADGTTQLEQTAVFSPKGVAGMLYWYALYPFHTWIFRGLIRSIARRAERMAASAYEEEPQGQVGGD